jgi:hypothetical protein
MEVDRWLVEEDRPATETTYYEVDAETREAAIKAVKAGKVEPRNTTTFPDSDGVCTYDDTHLR